MTEDGPAVKVVVDEFRYFYPEKNVRVKHKDPTKDNEYTDKPLMIDSVEKLHEAIDDYKNSTIENMTKV